MDLGEAARWLDCSRHASEEAILRAYRAACKGFHPDVWKDPSADQIMAYITKARDALLFQIHARIPPLCPVSVGAHVPRPRASRFLADVTIPGLCLACRATGFLFPEAGEPCAFCRGRGYLFASYSYTMTCNMCFGSGMKLCINHRCPDCDEGRRDHVVRLDFVIHPEAAPGEEILAVRRPDIGFALIRLYLENPRRE